jgi:glutamine synthetase
MAVAARRGLSDPDSLELAARLSTADHDDFEQVPSSCAESADALESERASFEADGVFPSELIDGLLDRLRAYDDAALMKELAKDDDARAELVRRHWHVG